MRQIREVDVFKRRARSLNNQARAAKVSSRITPLELEKLVRVYGLVCFYCKVKVTFDLSANDPNLDFTNTDKPATFDHVKPLSRQGGNTLDNLCICCMLCNNLKGSAGTETLLDYKPWDTYERSNSKEKRTARHSKRK